MCPDYAAEGWSPTAAAAACGSRALAPTSATASAPSAQAATSAAPHRFSGPIQLTMFSTSPWTRLEDPPSTGRCTIQAQIVPVGGPFAQVSVTAVIATTETDARAAVSQNRRANAGAS